MTGDRVGIPSGREQGNANVLALRVVPATGPTTFAVIFFDTTETTEMDFLCQYPAPVPCPVSSPYFAPDDYSSISEYGMPSCVRVVPGPATYDDAISKCAPDGTCDVGKPCARLFHPVVLRSVTGSQDTKLGTRVKDLQDIVATNPSQRQPLFTGGLFINNTPSWDSGRPFDSVVQGSPKPNTE